MGLLLVIVTATCLNAGAAAMRTVRRSSAVRVEPMPSSSYEDRYSRFSTQRFNYADNTVSDFSRSSPSSLPSYRRGSGSGFDVGLLVVEGNSVGPESSEREALASGDTRRRRESFVRPYREVALSRQPYYDTFGRRSDDAYSRRSSVPRGSFSGGFYPARSSGDYFRDRWSRGPAGGSDSRRVEDSDSGWTSLQGRNNGVDRRPEVIQLDRRLSAPDRGERRPLIVQDTPRRTSYYRPETDLAASSSNVGRSLGVLPAKAAGSSRVPDDVQLVSRPIYVSYT